MTCASHHSDVDPDNHVELFTTASREASDGSHWVVPVHAWVYTPQDSRVRKAALAALLKAQFGIEPTAEGAVLFARRANLMFADNHRRRRLAVEIAGRVFEPPPTPPNGHTRAEFLVPSADVERCRVRGSVAINLVLPPGDTRSVEGRSLLVRSEGLSVVSDIDDTVKISHVADRARLMDMTFFRDFEAVPGMAALYRRWAALGIAIHFVSSSPWHLYAPLREMLTAAAFPASTLDLKHIRLKDRTILDLFKDATRTKPPMIERLLTEFPGRRFVLVGDSGERDPEVYSGLARTYPGRIAQILIRNVTGEVVDDARLRRVFDGIPASEWQLFATPDEIDWGPHRPR